MLPVYHTKNSHPQKGNEFIFLEGNLRRRAAPMSITLLGTHQYTVHSNTLYTVIQSTQQYMKHSYTQYTAIHVVQYAEFQDQPVISL